MADWTKLTWHEAEKRTGCRLDRRRAYYANGAGVVVVEEALPSEPCTGCHEYIEGQCYCKTVPCVGSGCHECGYQGRVRQRLFMPVMAKDRPADSFCWDPKVNITERATTDANP